MRNHRRSVARLALFAAAAATFGALASGSALATGPPWEPDANSAAPYGNITFYDATGNVVTSGNDLTHIADYAVATSAPDAGATFATLSFAAPDHTKLTSLWAADAASASTAFPNSSAPTPIKTFTRPVVTLGSTDGCVICSIGGFVLDNTAGYENIIQVRLKDSGPGGAGSSQHYWSTDIMVDQGAGTWTQTYPILQPPTWKPVFSAAPQVGRADSCLAGFDGADAITYAWFLDNVTIPGATAASFTPLETDFGKQLSCNVTASNGAGQVQGTSDPQAVGTGPALVPTTKPYLFNGSNKTTVQHGKVESVNTGTWNPAATSFTYQWFKGSTKIGGATSSTFKPSASLVGMKLSCVVTAKRAKWADGSFKTAGVKVT
ncbi:MAG TPA: hypothetical protein VK646_05085 [Actinomycetota bacterium]|nr:hypothetical protein [Actinomycetota bacterium]